MDNDGRQISEGNTNYVIFVLFYYYLYISQCFTEFQITSIITVKVILDKFFVRGENFKKKKKLIARGLVLGYHIDGYKW